MTTPSPLADCCPECFPGDVPASLPVLVTGEDEYPGSLRAEYECPEGHKWACWWDRLSAGWPVTRETAA